MRLPLPMKMFSGTAIWYITFLISFNGCDQSDQPLFEQADQQSADEAITFWRLGILVILFSN